jgi:hypothetical protein
VDDLFTAPQRAVSGLRVQGRCTLPWWVAAPAQAVPALSAGPAPAQPPLGAGPPFMPDQPGTPAAPPTGPGAGADLPAGAAPDYLDQRQPAPDQGDGSAPRP